MAWPTVVAGTAMTAVQYNNLSAAISAWGGNVAAAGFTLTGLGGLGFTGSPAVTFPGTVTFTVAPVFTDQSGTRTALSLVASATTDTTNAANITSGTLPNARLVSVPNTALANSSITVTAGAGLATTGASISLGGSATLSRAEVVNAQSGTTYTMVAADQGKLVTFNNAGAIAVTLPQATTTFGSGWFCDVTNLGAGSATITPTTSTIGGSATLVLSTGQTCRIVSDGTNYQTALKAGYTAVWG